MANKSLKEEAKKSTVLFGVGKGEKQSSMRPIHFQVSMNPLFEGGLMSGLPAVEDSLMLLEIGNHLKASGERMREIESENPERRLNYGGVCFLF